MKRETVFSPCRNYRYTLWREWKNEAADLFSAPIQASGNSGYVQFIGLNPSTADETRDDPTIRRCIQFAKDWGYSAMCMTNLFAFRATIPSDMFRQQDPIGPGNDNWLQEIAKGAGIVVAAWGTLGVRFDRSAKIRKLIPNLHCIDVSANGEPRHPLYLPGHMKPKKL